eukprot:Skav217303  [mRNA]  locus=scaffold1466:323869:325762:- [translate_table: standard]
MLLRHHLPLPFRHLREATAFGGRRGHPAAVVEGSGGVVETVALHVFVDLLRQHRLETFGLRGRLPGHFGF